MSDARAPEIAYETVGRQKLRTAVWRSPDGDGRRPLLFFNGIGANLELAQPLAEAMPHRHVITFDMPGIGRSDPPVIPYRPWWVGMAAKEILARNGFDGDLDVIGVSWGGGAAQQFAMQYRRRVKRLILAATSSGMTMIPGDFSVISKMATPQRYLDRDYLMKNFQKLYGDEPGTMAKHSLRIIPPSMRGYFYQMLAMLGWTSLPFLPFLNVPTLLLAGGRDKIVPAINMKLMHKVMPDSKLHVVEDGGHLFIISRLPQILPTIERFLGEPHVEADPFPAAVHPMPPARARRPRSARKANGARRGGAAATA